MIIGIDISRANTTQRTGVENYVFYLVTELTKIIPHHVRVILYTREPLIDDLKFLEKICEVKVLKWKPKFFWTQIRLSYEMIVHRPDILFIPGHVVPIIHPKNTIMTVHDVAAYRFPNVYSFFERMYSILSAQYAVNHLAKVIVPSEFTKQELLSLVNQQQSQNIVVVHNGFDCDKKIVINKTNIKQITKPYLLYVGRKETKKNIVRLVEAFNRVKATHDIQLVLVGKEGYGYDEIKKKISTSLFKHDIIETGYVTDQQLSTLYTNAKAFMFVSLYEGFGFPVLEAMQHDCAVICSDKTSLPEITQDAALLVDAKNVTDIVHSIKKILTDQKVKDQLIKKGKKQITLFSWNDTANNIWKILQSL